MRERQNTICKYLQERIVLKVRNISQLFCTYFVLTVCFLLILTQFIGCDSCDKIPTEIEEPETVVDIDGNVYGTVRIGNQIWMAENLRVTHYRNGDPIPNVTDTETWNKLTSGAYRVYNSYDKVDLSGYGFLYNWYAAADVRNIAPEGWHVPTDEEWKELEMALGMSRLSADSTGSRGRDEGGKLKETGIRHWQRPNFGATNESGFSALPGGCAERTSFSLYLGQMAYFWTITNHSANLAWYRSMNYNSSKVFRGYEYQFKQAGFSIRCVKDGT